MTEPGEEDVAVGEAAPQPRHDPRDDGGPGVERSGEVAEDVGVPVDVAGQRRERAQHRPGGQVQHRGEHERALERRRGPNGPHPGPDGATVRGVARSCCAEPYGVRSSSVRS